MREESFVKTLTVKRADLGELASAMQSAANDPAYAGMANVTGTDENGDTVSLRVQFTDESDQA